MNQVTFDQYQSVVRSHKDWDPHPTVGHQVATCQWLKDGQVMAYAWYEANPGQPCHRSYYVREEFLEILGTQPEAIRSV